MQLFVLELTLSLFYIRVVSDKFVNEKGTSASLPALSKKQVHYKTTKYRFPTAYASE